MKARVKMSLFVLLFILAVSVISVAGSARVGDQSRPDPTYRLPSSKPSASVIFDIFAKAASERAVAAEIARAVDEADRWRLWVRLYKEAGQSQSIASTSAEQTLQQRVKWCEECLKSASVDRELLAYVPY